MIVGFECIFLSFNNVYKKNFIIVRTNYFASQRLFNILLKFVFFFLKILKISTEEKTNKNCKIDSDFITRIELPTKKISVKQKRRQR